MNVMHYLCALKNSFKPATKTTERRRYRPTLELLEGRLVPATIIVTSAADGIPAADGFVTLREAIDSVNALADTSDVTHTGTYGTNDTIKFNIAPGGLQTINVAAGGLPPLTKKVAILGDTQPSTPLGVPRIELNGAGAGSANGLVVQASGCLVKSLAINNFDGNGILVLKSNFRVVGSHIGTNFGGTAAAPNQGHGIAITGNATGVRIGVIGQARNVISGNELSGVAILGSGANSNYVHYNYIGTDLSGTIDLGNGDDGVFISAGSKKNVVGGTHIRERNVISGNDSDGVDISGGGTDHNLVHGNFIGTTFAGNVALGNSFNGVNIRDGARTNKVGGIVLIEPPTSPMITSRNIISGNQFNGVSIHGLGTKTNVVLGNFIGTDLSGTADLGNLMDGVLISGSAQKNFIGGPNVKAGNVISGNQSDGVEISNKETNGNVLTRNLIGTCFQGLTALGNSLNGVRIDDGAQTNSVGGTGDSKGNLISANLANGIEIKGLNTKNNSVLSNLIGTNKTGLGDLGNSLAGVLIHGRATDNRIGGSVATLGNLISGNDTNGVQISDIGTQLNWVQGNFIGTDLTGNAPLGNTVHGVSILNGAAKNLVGGLTSALGNLISANTNAGVHIANVDTTANGVQGNFIGTKLSGNFALGNGTGVSITDFAHDNFIGGTALGAGNLISGNAFIGVQMGGGAVSNFIQGNFIGTKANGLTALGNGFAGVAIMSGANGNFVGGTTAAAGNIISGNNGSGVTIFQPGTNKNQVEGNFIGANKLGNALGNTANGVFIASDAAFNMIGGIPAGAGNLIANNVNDGVLVGSTVGFTPAGIGNSILSNSIYQNGGQGIDLGPNDGDTLNDTTDIDGGPNDLLNKPRLTYAHLSGTSLFVMGAINTLVNSTGLRIEFFVNPPGGTQGKTFVGAIPASTDGFGNYSIIASLTVPLWVTAGYTLTATLTDGNGSTSEFSLPQVITV